MSEQKSSVDVVEIEERVTQLWKEILGIAVVASEDDFFSLGGDSLRTVEMMTAVEAKFGIYLDPVELLDQPTVRGFATLIAGILSERPDSLSQTAQTRSAVLSGPYDAS